ncbi:GNAT family N-acetyltransferase [Pseudolysinimonas sp.]|jgi:ribosomal protein S18 acetylase RimI-like enzyme|uniref:GNAT family N-acetyltransferase n=1 Tax=Pseudolysinimonas sp. TaxID=2680009 RepID=UPI0037830BC4
MGATIRPARQDDLAAIERIVHDAYRGYIPRMGTKPGPMLADYASVLATRLVDVVDDGEILGVVVLDREADGMLLENVAVAPAAQGRGLGRMLIRHAEARAREAGCPTIRLYTHVTMVENLALYERVGYIETGRGDSEGFDRVFLSKRLDGSRNGPES